MTWGVKKQAVLNRFMRGGLFEQRLEARELTMGRYIGKNSVPAVRCTDFEVGPTWHVPSTQVSHRGWSTMSEGRAVIEEDPEVRRKGRITQSLCSFEGSMI